MTGHDKKTAASREKHLDPFAMDEQAYMPDSSELPAAGPDAQGTEQDSPSEVTKEQPLVEGDTSSSPEELFSDLGQEFAHLEDVESAATANVTDSTPVTATDDTDAGSGDKQEDHENFTAYMADAILPEAAPVYADMRDAETNTRSLRVMVVIAAAVVVLIAAIYWSLSPASKSSESGAKQTSQAAVTTTNEGPVRGALPAAAEPVDAVINTVVEPSVDAVAAQPGVQAGSAQPGGPAELQAGVRQQQPAVEQAASTGAHVSAQRESLLSQPESSAVAASPSGAPIVTAEAAQVSARPPHTTVEKTEAEYLAAQKASAERIAAGMVQQQQATKPIAVQLPAAAKPAVDAAVRVQEQPVVLPEDVQPQAVIEPETVLQKPALQAVTTPAAVKLVPATTPPAVKLVPAAVQAGHWVVYLSSSHAKKTALQLVARIKAMGVDSRVVAVHEKGQLLYRVRHSATVDNQSKARQLRDDVAKKLGLQAAWVVQE